MGVHSEAHSGHRGHEESGFTKVVRWVNPGQVHLRNTKVTEGVHLRILGTKFLRFTRKYCRHHLLWFTRD